MIEMVNALWRPITSAIMGLVILAIAAGVLPPSAEAHATELLLAAGSIITVLAGLRTTQRVQEVKAQAQEATALPTQLRAAADDPQLIGRLAENVARVLTK